MALGPKIWNALPEKIRKKHSLLNSRNMLNLGQVRFSSASCAYVFRNYGNSLVISEVLRHLTTFEKQP